MQTERHREAVKRLAQGSEHRNETLTARKKNPPPPLPEKLLYDKKSVAYALSISVRKLEYMLANKMLSFSRNGAKVLIPASELRRVSKLSQLMEH